MVNTRSRRGLQGSTPSGIASQKHILTPAHVSSVSNSSQGDGNRRLGEEIRTRRDICPPVSKSVHRFENQRLTGTVSRRKMSIEDTSSSEGSLPPVAGSTSSGSATSASSSGSAGVLDEFDEGDRSHYVSDSSSQGDEEDIHTEMLPKRFFSTDRYPTDGRVNSYSKPQYLVDILSILDGTKELKQLKNSPFSSLFHLPVRRCSLSGKLLHNFLCRQIVTTNSHEIWFTYGGYPLRFSLNEFQEITGLPCGSYPDKDTLTAAQTHGENDSPYWYTLIGRQTEVSIDDIVKKLKAEPTMPGWKKIRLALIVIVEGVLICGTQPIRASFPIVEMVRNLDFFFSYPWGRHAFERTIRMIKVGNKVQRQYNLINKLKQPSLVLHGFPIAIQLMLFQSIPLLLRYVPSFDDEQSFYDKGLTELPKLKTFHTRNIVELEHDIKLHVQQVLFSSTERCRESEEVDYEGDEQVAHMVRLIKKGYKFSKADWRGGDESLPKLCICKDKKHNGCNCGCLICVDKTGNSNDVKYDSSSERTSSDIAKLRVEVARMRKTYVSSFHKLNATITELHSYLLSRKCLSCNISDGPFVGGASTTPEFGGKEIVELSRSSKSVQTSGNDALPLQHHHIRRQAEASLTDQLQVGKSVPSNVKTSPILDKEDVNVAETLLPVSHPCLQTMGEDVASTIVRDTGGYVDDNAVKVDGCGSFSMEMIVSDVISEQTHQHEMVNNNLLTPRNAPEGQAGHVISQCTVTYVNNLSVKLPPPKLCELPTERAPKLCNPLMECRGKRSGVSTGNHNLISAPKRSKLSPGAAGDYIPFRQISKKLIHKFKQMLKAYCKLSYDIDGCEVGSNFFEEIYTPKKWLFKTHLDMMLRPFWRQRGSYLAGRKVVVLDSLLTQLLTAQYRKFIHSSSSSSYDWHPLLSSYIEGTVGDRKEKTSWLKDVMTVYVPMNWGNRHWVGLVICLKKWHIDIMDPYIKCTSEEDVASYMEPVVKMLPHLIKASCEVNDMSHVHDSEFTYCRVGGLAQNTRTGDCGAYVMKFIEMHSHEFSTKEMGDITNEMVNMFRMQYAIDVYEEFIDKVCL